jgi:hypothetical protein
MLLSAQELDDAEHIPICYDALDREDEFVSENATRNIFGWLRVDGYARHERNIWKHEWLDMSDSDEDDVDCVKDYSGDRSKLSSRVEAWVSGLKGVAFSNDDGGEVLDSHNADSSDTQ